VYLTGNGNSDAGEWSSDGRAAATSRGRPQTVVEAAEERVAGTSPSVLGTS